MEEFPVLAATDCDVCRRHIMDGSKAKMRDGKPVKRAIGNKPPCEGPAGCPKGHWSNPVTMSTQDQAAYMHYRRCKLTGQWPDDAIVIERGVALQDVEEAVALKREAMRMRLL